MFRRKSLLFLSVIFFCSLIACSKNSKEERVAQTALLNDIVKHESVLGVQEISLDKVHKTTSYGDEIPENDFFIIAEMSYKNIGEESIPFVKYADRLWLNRHAAAFYKYTPSEQDLNPNEVTSIKVAFDINEAETYKLTFIFGIYEQYDIIWNIKEEDFQ